MPVSDEYLESVREWLSFVDSLRIRRMFGGAMVSRNDLPFALVADDVLYLRVDEVNRPDFVAAGMDMFQPFPDRPMKMPYGEVPAEVIEDREELERWVEGALDAACRDAVKKKRKS